MFCTHCGAEINDDAFVCVKCGCRVDQKLPAAQANAQRDDTMVTVIKVFLILGCIAEGWLLIPIGMVHSDDSEDLQLSENRNADQHRNGAQNALYHAFHTESLPFCPSQPLFPNCQSVKTMLCAGEHHFPRRHCFGTALL